MVKYGKTIKASNKFLRWDYGWDQKAETNGIKITRYASIISGNYLLSALVSVDGLMICICITPPVLKQTVFSAMTAAMLSLGERISLELSRGALNELYIRGQEGYVLVNAVGEDAVLTVMTREEAKLGLIFLEMRRAASDLEKILA